MERMDMPPEAIEMVRLAMARQQESADFEVWQENWESFLAFEAMATQWRIVGGMGGVMWLGLEYPAAEIVMRRRGVDPTRQDAVFCDLQVMERAALEVLNQKRD